MQKQSTSNQLCAPVSHKSSVKLHSVICAFCQTSPHISQDSRRIANKWQSLSIHLQACMNSWHLPRANKVQKQIKHPCFYTFLTPRKALKRKSCAFFSNMKRTCSCRWCLLDVLKGLHSNDLRVLLSLISASKVDFIVAYYTTLTQTANMMMVASTCKVLISLPLIANFCLMCSKSVHWHNGCAFPLH